MDFKSFENKKGHLDHFRYLLEGVLTLLDPVLPLSDILNGRSHLVKSTPKLHPRPLLSLPADVCVENAANLICLLVCHLVCLLVCLLVCNLVCLLVCHLFCLLVCHLGQKYL